MEKTEKKDNKFAKGALVLLLGGIVCKLIGGFYRVPLSNILGAEGIGVYQLIFPVYSLFLIVVSGGIPVALSKLVASCNANNQIKRAIRFLFQAIVILTVVSLVFGVVFFVLGNQIASFQGNSQANLGYFGVAVAIVFASVLTGFRGYFQGYQNMTPTAVSQIIEQILKLVLGLTFASLLIERGVSFGVLGAMLGVAVGEVVALLYLAFCYFFKRKKTSVLEPEIKIPFWKDFKLLLKDSLPIRLNAIILPLILAVDSFLVVNLLSGSGASQEVATQMFGVYSGMVNSLINLPTVVSLAIATCLVPSISFNNEKNKQNNSVGAVFKTVMFVCVPCVLVYFVFANQIILVLYPSATNLELLNLGASLLKISAINIIYISILQITTSILQAKNKSFLALFNLGIAGILKVLMTIIFVSSPLGIFGAAISSILCYAIASGLNVVSLVYLVDFKVGLRTFFFILLNSLFATGIAIGFNYLFGLFVSNSFSLIFSLFIAIITYFILTLFLPIFSETEIEKIPFGNRILFFKNKFLNIFRKKRI